MFVAVNEWVELLRDWAPYLFVLAIAAIVFLGKD